MLRYVLCSLFETDLLVFVAFSISWYFSCVNENFIGIFLWRFCLFLNFLRVYEWSCKQTKHARHLPVCWGVGWLSVGCEVHFLVGLNRVPLNGLNQQQQQKDQPQRGHSLHKKHKNSTKNQSVTSQASQLKS